MAESAVIVTVFGGVAELLAAFDVGPGQKNPQVELEAYRAKGGPYR